MRNANDHEKVAHLRQMNNIGAGTLELYEADLTVAGSCASTRYSHSAYRDLWLLY